MILKRGYFDVLFCTALYCSLLHWVVRLSTRPQLTLLETRHVRAARSPVSRRVWCESRLNLASRPPPGYQRGACQSVMAARHLIGGYLNQSLAASGLSRARHAHVVDRDKRWDCDGASWRHFGMVFSGVFKVGLGVRIEGNKSELLPVVCRTG